MVAFGWMAAFGVVVASVGGLGAGVAACLRLADIKPHPVLLTCAPPPTALAVPATLPARAHPPPSRGTPVPFNLPPADLLATSEPETHDPSVLAVRALAMKAAGIPVDVRMRGIARDVVAKGLSFRINATPVRRRLGPDEGADGVELATIPTGSLLERAGFVQGDVVLSVNGYPAAQPAWIDRVRVEPGGSTVVELLRAKQRMIFVLEWLPDRTR